MTSKTKRGESKNATRLVKVLAHDLRQQIMRLSIDRTSPVSPREASEELPAVLSNVAYHFRVLAEVNALQLDETRSVRGVTQHFYSPNPTVVEMPMVKEILTATAT